MEDSMTKLLASVASTLIVSFFSLGLTLYNAVQFTKFADQTVRIADCLNRMSAQTNK